MIKLFYAYLNDRKQFVSLRGLRSVEYGATSGVPQGSVLGPLLFILFINDIVDILDVNCLLYADDLKLYCSIDGPNDCLRLQDNLDRLSLWCTNNRLPLNVAKCCVLSFTLKAEVIRFGYSIDSVVLQRADSFRDLGVTFDVKLSFSIHIQQITTEAMKTYGFLARNSREFRNVSTLKVLYNSFIRSKLEYASIVWSPHYKVHIDSIEAVQRKFLKLLSFKLDSVYPCIGFSHDLLLQRHSVSLLDDRRKYCQHIFVVKLLRGMIDSPQLKEKLVFATSRENARFKLIFNIPTPRTNVLKYSPVHMMCNACNKHSDIDLLNCSISDIRRLYF